MNANELCVPAGALAIHGEQGDAVPPGVGDEVEFTVRGNVTRAEGDKVYVTPTSANGEPIEAPAGGPDGAEGDDETSMDAAVNGYRTQAVGGPGAGMILALVTLFLALTFAPEARAQANQVREANRKDVTVVQTNNWVAATGPSQLFSVTVYNSGSSTVYLLVFDSATNATVNTRPAMAAVRVPANETWGYDFAANGVPFDYGVCVAISTTPLTLTNAAAVGDMFVSRRFPR